MRVGAHFLVIGCALALSACGEEGEPAPSAATPTATVTATPTPSPAATATPVPVEGGDENANRVPLTITLAAEDVLPPRTQVPAFLGIDLEVVNESGAERTLRLDGKVILELEPGRAQRATLQGLQPGDHRLEAGESGRATIVAKRAG